MIRDLKESTRVGLSIRLQVSRSLVKGFGFGFML